MSFLEKKKRKHGDRRDGIWIKDAPSINIIMASLYPNRCDCEVSMKQELDITELLKYIDEKNQQNSYKTKFFHCIVYMMVRILNTRRRLNRFVQGGRIYERDFITVSFVAKRMFNDEAEEVLLTYKAKPEHNITDVSKFILGEVDEVRDTSKKQNNKKVTDNINNVAKLPTWFVRLITSICRCLDKKGKVPKSLTHGDPAFSSVLLSNLGSIKCPAVYHHLNNYGTNSIMMTIGQITKKNILQEDGTIISRDVVDVQVTADERIADGFYFAKSLKILNYICENPKVLDMRFDEDVDFGNL